MMCPPDLSPGSRPARKPRKAGFTRTMESLTTPVELALPGLEGSVVTDVSPEHWIERGPQKRLMVFSGRSHPELAQRITEQLGVELGLVELESFKNGETYCPFAGAIRGTDLFIVQ